MKKALSIILALIMALTMALPAFAADNEIKLGEPKQASVGIGEKAELVFTPKEDGIYTINCEMVEGEEDSVSFWFDLNCIQNYVYNAKGEEESIKLLFIGQKGKSIPIYFDTWMDLPYTVSVKIDKVDCSSLSEGVNSVKVNRGGSAFLFVPEKDGYYNFASECKNDVDFEIIDSADLEEYNDDNGYKCDRNFDCTVSLKAGEMYLITVSHLDKKPVADCDVIITYGKTENVEKIKVLGSHWLERNTVEFVYIDFTPSGSWPTADVKATSSDESVISIGGYDAEFGEISVITHGTGKAVITVTADGVTETFKVKVCNDFEYAILRFFRNIFDDSQLFFSRILDFFTRLF